MNPEQRAESLVYMMQQNDRVMPNEYAIKCAIITVDTILSYPTSLTYDIVWYEFVNTDLTFTYSEPMESFKLNALEYWCNVREYLVKQKI
jgi:hypothetical protein